MLVKEIMTPKMEWVSPAFSLQEAARKMRELDVGSLPIYENGQLLGIITDRDICCRAVAEGLQPGTTTVREIMSRDVAFCFDDDDINEAARLMEQKHIRRVAVLTRDRTPAGLLSVDDLAHHSYQLAGRVLDAVGPRH